MQPLLVAGLLKFANFLPHIQMLYKEYEGCLHGVGHDDIPDVISRQRKYAPRVVQMASKPETSTRAFLVSPEQASWNMMFADGDQFGRPGLGITVPQPIVATEPEPEYHVPEMYPGVVNVIGL